MGRVIELLSADGFQLDAYLTIPKGKPKGGVVVVQEIFGVNEHIKAIVNDFAQKDMLHLHLHFLTESRKVWHLAT